MTAPPSDVWFNVFPGPRIPDVLAYVAHTWDWLQRTFATAVSFDHKETELTDNLCEALEDGDRRRAHRIDCDFQPEGWELRRATNGKTVRVARTDIKVILGTPGTPHLVLEFKKLDGSTNARWRYCFCGMNRFLEGKYAIDHTHGVMFGISPNDLAAEADTLADYIAQEDNARRLRCITNGHGHVITAPSEVDPTSANFDTTHARPGVGKAIPITLLHALLPCPERAKSKAKTKGGRRLRSKAARR